MPKDVDTVLDYRDVFPDDDAGPFARLLEDRIALTDTIKELEEQKKTLDTNITRLMTDIGSDKLRYGYRAVSIVQGSRSNLNKEKLLLAGVTATTITACTDTTAFTYLLVGKGKA